MDDKKKLSTESKISLAIFATLGTAAVIGSLAIYSRYLDGALTTASKAADELIHAVIENGFPK